MAFDMSIEDMVNEVSATYLQDALMELNDLHDELMTCPWADKKIVRQNILACEAKIADMC